MERKRRNKGNGGVQQVGPDKFRLFYEGPRKRGEKRNQRTETFSGTAVEAQKRLRALLSSVDAGEWRKPHKETVAEYLARWMRDYAEPNTSLRTQRGYQGNIDRYIIPTIGNVPLSGLQPEHVAALHRSMAAKGLSGRTQLHAHRLLSAALERAIKWRLLRDNPCRLVDAPRAEHIEMRVWDFEQIGQFMRAADGSQYRDLFALMFETALRRSEALAVRWTAVDLEQGNLEVRKGLHRIKGQGLVELDTKTERSRRRIALSEHAVQLLRQVKGTQLARAAEFDLPWDSEGFVFARADARPFDPERVSKGFTEIRKAAGLPPCRLHDARHAAASHMLAAGAPLAVVSERLGHSDITTTLRFYAHAIPGQQREVAEAYSRKLWGS